MSYYDNKNKSVGKVSKSNYYPTSYITVHGEILDKSFKEDYNYNFINTVIENENGRIKTIKIVELGTKKSKQCRIEFE